MKCEKNDVDEILRTCFIEAMERDVEKLNEQTENMEPHVFSEEFEQKMKSCLLIGENRLDAEKFTIMLRRWQQYWFCALV